MRKMAATDRGAFMRRLNEDLKRDPALRQRVETRLNEIRFELGHTVDWPDGLRVIRVMIHKRQIVLFIDWQGRRHELRLGPRVHTLRRLSKKERSGT